LRTIIHVNQHKIRAGEQEVLTVKTYKSNDYASEADIVVDGKVVARIVYRPETPLSCGAKVWIETENEVRLNPVAA
jgi:cytidylate kinase